MQLNAYQMLGARCQNLILVKTTANGKLGLSSEHQCNVVCLALSICIALLFEGTTIIGLNFWL